MIVDPMGSRYPTDEAELRFYKAVEEEVRTLPRRSRRGLGDDAAARDIV